MKVKIYMLVCITCALRVRYVTWKHETSTRVVAIFKKITLKFKVAERISNFATKM